jgi:hypothetical protein
MHLLTRPLAAAALTAAWLLSAAAANAQAPSTSSPSPGTSKQAADITDQKLDATAAALEQVLTVKRGYQQKIEAANPSDRKRIADEADVAVEEAVTKQGISVEEYTSILVVAQNDPAVREKILQRMRPSDK